MSLRFLAEAETEYLAVIRYYREIDPRLAADLITLVDERLRLPSGSRASAESSLKLRSASNFDGIQ